MKNYVDTFLLPIAKAHVDTYRKVSEQVASIWIEHGALAYHEYLGDALEMEGVRGFPEMLEVTEDETLIFGWTIFPDRATRDKAHEKVPADPRMEALVAPLLDPSKKIFQAERMLFGGFKPLVQVDKEE